MKRAMLAILLTFGIFTGLQPAETALGSVGSPSALEKMGPQQQPKERSLPADAIAAGRKSERKISSLYARIKQEILAKFRPVERKDSIDFEAAQAMLTTKTASEKLFDKDFEKKMRVEYANKVQPFEGKVNDPIWRARYWEQKRYEDGRNSLAKWTAREALDDQLNDFINGGDSDSAPMKVLSTAHKLSGGGEDKDEPTLSPAERAARAHRRDLPPIAEEEEKVPTRLKTKINVVKQEGALVFQNPIAMASVNGSKDAVTANINKEFHKLTLRSALNFKMKESELNLNLNKRISQQVSVDFDHYAYTGGKKGASGETSKEQARVNYNVSF
jgi:hypothetical protein